jgi:methenyltetrahydromethanopterin cyclohydrolase
VRGLQADKILMELCIGAAGKTQLGFKNYSYITHPSITIPADHLAIAALVSIFVSWRTKEALFVTLNICVIV